MRYAIFNFLTGTRSECLPRNIINLVMKRDTECRVAQATTVEDESFLGTDWECEHCLPPTECVHCNPAYRHAVLKHCDKHDPGGTSCSWHVGDTCLGCKITTQDWLLEQVAELEESQL